MIDTYLTDMPVWQEWFFLQPQCEGICVLGTSHSFKSCVGICFVLWIAISLFSPFVDMKALDSLLMRHLSKALVLSGAHSRMLVLHKL